MLNSNSFSKTICSICYEDLKPIVEDLQSISICGHVFHELCLQQWFEYCSGGKKYSCPVCKQSCSAHNAARLYFQSVGDPSDTLLSQKQADCVQDPELLQQQVRRLEEKVSRLHSTVEHQGNDLRELQEELCLCKEQAKKETTLKNEALNQKASIQKLLHSKAEALDKSTLECFSLQERNVALAKELAALKLVSDLNLDEEEVFKLASFGNEANRKDTIDILKRSLVIRNKSYKELMAKCNLLGRGEARYSKKHEKAKEKISKLKTRIQELEMAAEAKDNEVLRALKASKKTVCKEDMQNDVICNPNSRCVHKLDPEDQVRKPSVTGFNLNLTGSLNNCSMKTKDFTAIEDTAVNYCNEGICTKVSNEAKDAYILIDEDDSEFCMPVHGLSNPDPKFQTGKAVSDQKSNQLMSESSSEIIGESNGQSQDKLVGLPGSGTVINNDMGDNASAAARDENVAMNFDENRQVKQMLNIRKETRFPHPLSKPGDRCFSGGLLGPDGTSRYLGKWCKRDQEKVSIAKRSSTSKIGDLVAIGADGRGGRVKVLRSLNQSSLDSKETSECTKRFKYGAKKSSLQSQGCLQMEHFFGRVGH